MRIRKLNFKGLFKRSENLSDPINPKDWLLKYLFSGFKTFSGRSVNAESSVENTAVLACVRIISETVASLPLNLYREMEKGGKERAKQHYLFRLLKYRPNSYMTAFNFWETAVTHILLYGNVYIFIERFKDLRGTIKALHIRKPEKISVRQDEDGEILYRYSVSGGSREYTKKEILHIPGWGFNGIVGRSVIGLAKEAISQGLSAEEFASRFFGNGTSAKLLLKVPSDVELDEDGEKYLERYINTSYAGVQNSHKPIILRDGIGLEELKNQNNKDSQLIELRKFQLEEVARIFRVPLHLLQNLDKSTNNNIEHQSIDFVVHTVRPWLVRIEQCLNVFLIPFYEWGEYYCEFNVDGLLRGDNASRAEYYSKALNWGWMNRDEVREKENMNPISEGKGKEYFVPVNMQTVDNAVKQNKV